MKQETLDALNAARAALQPIALATRLEDGAQWLIVPDQATTDAPTEIVEAAQVALFDDQSRTVETDLGAVFLQVHNPPLRMAIIGAVHIAQALAPMATRAGFAVTVIDPRGAFATEDRFPGVIISDEWPDDAMTALAPDRRTAVVTLTHDPKLDDPALDVALKSEAFYVGSLGSKKTHAARRQRLRDMGFDDTVIDRIRGPIGLSIGAKSPAEIAVSILAQIIEARRNPPNSATATDRAA